MSDIKTASTHLPENTLARRFTREVNRVMDDEPVDMYRILMLFLNLQAVVSTVTKEPESMVMCSDYGMCMLYNDDEILIGISDEDSGCHILLRDDTQHSETVRTMSDFPSVVKDKILSYTSQSQNRKI